MKHWKRLLIPATALCLMTPAVLWAEGEFQNPTQAEKANNLAEAWTSDDEAFKDQIASEVAEDQVASDYAEAVVDQISSDYAYREVKQVSRDHALNNVTGDIPENLDELASTAADKFVEEKAIDYADSVAAGDPTEYQKAYEDALARAYGASYNNLWDTTYEGAIKRALDDDQFEKWQEDYNSAYARGTAVGDWENLFETEYARAQARATAEGDWENAFETAYNHALEGIQKGEFDEEFEEAYKQALEQVLAEDIYNKKVEYVSYLRLVEGYGWGVIARKELGIHPSNLGMKRGWKKGPPALEDDVAPPEPELLSLDEEIAQVTRRNTKTGWNEAAGFNAKNNKNKNSKKTYGLTQTSGVATSDVQGNKALNRGQSKKNNKSSSSVQTITSTSSQSAQGGSPGIGSSSKSKGSNKGGNSSSNSNKGGNSSNNGNNGGKSNDNGNNGNNGNSGKGGKGKNK